MYSICPLPTCGAQVELLVRLTGLNPVPEEKAPKFGPSQDKVAAAQLTPLSSECVPVRRVQECPAQLEARVKQLTGGAAVGVQVLRVHLRRDSLSQENYVDPARWQRLIYNFCHYYGLGKELGKRCDQTTA